MKLKGELIMNNKGWQSMFKDGEQTKDHTSFLGGKPKLPEGMEIPRCDICNKEQVFLFQVSFPAGHVWAGKSMAVFKCLSMGLHTSERADLPDIEQIGYDDIPKGNLEEKFHKAFRMPIFNTECGFLKEDYEEKVIFRAIEWKVSRAKAKKVPIVLGGEEIYIMGKKEKPNTYDGTPMHLILQVAENFNFDILNEAPGELEEIFRAIPKGTLKPGESVMKIGPREEKIYSLFYDFNRVYIWGADDLNDPKVAFNVQNNV